MDDVVIVGILAMDLSSDLYGSLPGVVFDFLSVDCLVRHFRLLDWQSATLLRQCPWGQLYRCWNTVYGLVSE